ncbi:uncharacterized protein LOC143250467 isoform X3 [Tachypleus tridentatus]|uniref:uncharacterized protein LOC143250467 isoform X3 n=1 Tax=Tachypleus tridentatus TaxID=6853 RepID=UPI003FD12433
MVKMDTSHETVKILTEKLDVMVNQGHHLEKQDVEAVVDGICQENLLEVDITHFLQMICGHVKDFKVTMSLEETCKSFEKSSNKIVLEQDIYKKDGDASMIPEGERWNIMMWLDKQSDDNENAEKSERDRFSDGTCASSKTEWH